MTYSEDRQPDQPPQPARRLGRGAVRWEKGGYGWNQIQTFNRQHPDTPVEVISAGQNFTKLFTQQVSSGSFPDLTLGSIDLPTVRARDWVVPISELGIDLKPRYPKEMWVDGITTAEGQIYSWGQDDGRGVFLGSNTKFLADAGSSKPPKSWAELIELSSAVHAKDKEGVRHRAAVVERRGDHVHRQHAAPRNPGQPGRLRPDRGRYAMAFCRRDGDNDRLEDRTRSTELLPAVLASRRLPLDGPGSVRWLTSVTFAYTVSVPPRREAGQQPLLYGSLSASSFFVFKESKNLESLGALVDFLTGEEFVRGQLETNYSITAVPELNRKFAPNEQVKQLLAIQDQVIQPPIPQTDAQAMEARKKETALPAPRQAPADIAAGVLAGKITDWKKTR